MALNSSLYTPAEGYTLVFDLNQISFRLYNETWVYLSLLAIFSTLLILFLKREKQRPMKPFLKFIGSVFLVCGLLFTLLSSFVFYQFEKRSYEKFSVGLEKCTLFTGQVQEFKH